MTFTILDPQLPASTTPKAKASEHAAAEEFAGLPFASFLAILLGADPKSAPASVGVADAIPAANTSANQGAMLQDGQPNAPATWNLLSPFVALPGRPHLPVDLTQGSVAETEQAGPVFPGALAGPMSGHGRAAIPAASLPPAAGEAIAVVRAVTMGSPPPLNGEVAAISMTDACDAPAPPGRHDIAPLAAAPAGIATSPAVRTDVPRDQEPAATPATRPESRLWAASKASSPQAPASTAGPSPFAAVANTTIPGSPQEPPQQPVAMNDAVPAPPPQSVAVNEPVTAAPPQSVAVNDPVTAPPPMARSVLSYGPNVAPPAASASSAQAAAGSPTAVALTGGSNPAGHATPLAGYPQSFATVSQPAAVPLQVARQLGAFALKGGETQRLTLQLEPEHLGRVEVQLTVRGDRIEVVLQAETPAAAQALRDGAQELARTLNGKGEARWQHVEVRIVETSTSLREQEDADSDPEERPRDDRRREQQESRRRDEPGRYEGETP